MHSMQLRCNNNLTNHETWEQVKASDIPKIAPFINRRSMGERTLMATRYFERSQQNAQIEYLVRRSLDGALTVVSFIDRSSDREIIWVSTLDSEQKVFKSIKFVASESSKTATRQEFDAPTEEVSKVFREATKMLSAKERNELERLKSDPGYKSVEKLIKKVEALESVKHIKSPEGLVDVKLLSEAQKTLSSIKQIDLTESLSVAKRLHDVQQKLDLTETFTNILLNRDWQKLTPWEWEKHLTEDFGLSLHYSGIPEFDEADDCMKSAMLGDLYERLLCCSYEIETEFDGEKRKKWDQEMRKLMGDMLSESYRPFETEHEKNKPFPYKQGELEKILNRHRIPKEYQKVRFSDHHIWLACTPGVKKLFPENEESMGFVQLGWGCKENDKNFFRDTPTKL